MTEPFVPDLIRIFWFAQQGLIIALNVIIVVIIYTTNSNTYNPPTLFPRVTTASFESKITT